MHFILDKEKIMGYSAVLESKCGKPFLHAWKKRPVKTPVELHEETCPICQDIIRTGIVPPEIAIEKRKERERWIQEYVDEIKKDNK